MIEGQEIETKLLDFLKREVFAPDVAIPVATVRETSQLPEHTGNSGMHNSSLTRFKCLDYTARMKIKFPFVLSILLVAFLTGCSSTGENVPRYGKSVQVVPYTNLAGLKINPDFQVFASEADVRRPFKVVALVGRCAKPNDQGLMMTAIAWRAKQLGADAMIVQPPAAPSWNYTDFGKFAVGGAGEPFYRAHAIVYELP